MQLNLFCTYVSRDRQTLSFASISKQFSIKEKTLWNWYNQGSKLIRLAAGGRALLILLFKHLALTNDAYLFCRNFLHFACYSGPWSEVASA